MGVDEPGDDGPAAGVDLLVGRGCSVGRADPGHGRAVDDESRVDDDPEQVVGVGVVGDQLADVGDDRGAHAQTLPITSSRSRPSCSRSSARKTIRPSATTWVTSSATAAKTAVCSSAPVPAVRTRSVAIVTRSARRPTAIAPASSQPRESWRVAASSSSAARPVAAPLRRETLVELDGAHLLERVDHGMAVTAEGQRAAGVVQGPARPDAVPEVALGGRAEAGVRRGLAQEAHVIDGQMRGVHGAGERTEHAGVREHPGGRCAVRPEAGVVLPHLLREMHVEAAGPRPPRRRRRARRGGRRGSSGSRHRSGPSRPAGDRRRAPPRRWRCRRRTAPARPAAAPRTRS